MINGDHLLLHVPRWMRQGRRCSSRSNASVRTTAIRMHRFAFQCPTVEDCTTLSSPCGWKPELHSMAYHLLSASRCDAACLNVNRVRHGKNGFTFRSPRNRVPGSLRVLLFCQHVFDGARSSCCDAPPINHEGSVGHIRRLRNAVPVTAECATDYSMRAVGLYASQSLTLSRPRRTAQTRSSPIIHVGRPEWSMPHERR